MNLTGRLNELIQDPLASFKALQISIAGICIFIPVILRLSDNDTFYPGRFNAGAALAVNNCSTTVAVDSSMMDCHGNPSAEIVLKFCGDPRMVSSFTRIVTDKLGFRYSLSDYAYSTRSYFFWNAVFYGRHDVHL